MKQPQCRRNCLHCKELFLPNYRSGPRQRYCHQPACRQASQRASQRAWLTAFRKRYPKAKAWLVGATGIKLEEFFFRPAPEWFQ